MGPEPAGGRADGGGTSWRPPHTDNDPVLVNAEGVSTAGVVDTIGPSGAGATGACAKADPAHRAANRRKLLVFMKDCPQRGLTLAKPDPLLAILDVLRETAACSHLPRCTIGKRSILEVHLDVAAAEVPLDELLG